MPTADVPEKYIKTQKSFKEKERLWTFWHYALGLSAAVLAFLAGSKAVPNLTSETWVSGLALASGTASVVLTFLSPASKKQVYAEARNHLRVARFRYEESKSYTTEDLGNALEAAQDIVAKR